VPDYTNAENITLAELMSHTSGLFDYFQHPDYNLRVFNEPDHAWTAQEILTDFWRKPYCDPGTCYEYSNTNFVLLGMVVERETREELGDVLRERFFEPLELDETFSQCEAPPPPGSARGYLVRPERSEGLDDGTDYRPTLSAATVACSVGDIVSTSTDLADWARDLYGGHLLDPDSLALMTDYDYSPYADETYGLGTRTRVIDGARLFGHTGSLRGFDAAMWHAPDLDLTMVVLTNRGRIDANPIIDALAAIALPYARAYSPE
jgi:D-alanyl-D-alanine carboxypeptidase